jgi:serine/threonine-protein kinase
LSGPPYNRPTPPAGEPTAPFEREHDVLGAIAEGYTNDAIARQLFLSPKTVEANIHRLLLKLGITESPDSNRRVLAVLTYLRSA